MSFYIRGSDISAVCGKNKYQPIDDRLFKKIHEYNNGVYKDISKTGDKKLDAVVKKISKEKGELTEILKEIEINNDERQIVIEKATIMRGNIYETNDLQKYVNEKNEKNRDNKQNIKTTIRNNNSKIYTLKICNISIRSKIDGVEFEDDKPIRLVETKRRRNRLFHEIPEYEKVQMEVYLRTINLTHALHIENFKDENNILEYIRDDEFWIEITDGIDKFIIDYNNYINTL